MTTLFHSQHPQQQNPVKFGCRYNEPKRPTFLAPQKNCTGHSYTFPRKFGPTAIKCIADIGCGELKAVSGLPTLYIKKWKEIIKAFGFSMLFCCRLFIFFTSPFLPTLFLKGRNCMRRDRAFAFR